MIYKGDIPPPSSEWSFPYNKVTISNLVLPEIDTLSKYRYSGWRAMSHMSQVTHVSRMNDVPHERWGQTCLVPKSQTKWNKLYKKNLWKWYLNQLIILILILFFQYISYLQSIVSPTSRISNQLSDNFNTNLFPFRYLSNILYLQYIASPISSISNISKLQYLISPIYHISNISYLQYLVSPIFCISDILYLQYLVSPISHISNIWNIQVSNLWYLISNT